MRALIFAVSRTTPQVDELVVCLRDDVGYMSVSDDEVRMAMRDVDV
ncbi:MAG: hypothetical protein JO352_19485 [Chloroflexi bacterium]|nr:hypothetical protein [Chloroflexota bacterium]